VKMKDVINYTKDKVDSFKNNIINQLCDQVEARKDFQPETPIYKSKILNDLYVIVTSKF
jgi:hypothetical protein